MDQETGLAHSDTVEPEQMPRHKGRRPLLLLGCVGAALLSLCAVGVLLASTVLWFRVADRPLPVVGERTARFVNRITFIDPAGQIGTVAPDGSDLRLLTAGEERIFLFPAWSPGGDRVAAIGGDQEGTGVYVLADDPAAAEQAPHEVYYSRDEGPFYLYWSPDGQQISFLANHPEGIGLHLAPAGGGAASRLLLTGQPFYWDWAADGRRLFYHTGFATEDAGLGYLDLETDEPGENVGQAGYFQAPDISPDERHTAFAEVDAAGARWLVVQDSESGEEQRTPHFGLVALSWSPTEPSVAFISPDRPGDLDDGFFGSLRLFDAESGETRLLTSDLVLAFFWSPDGRSIAYLTLPPADEDIAAVKDGDTRLMKPAAQGDDVLRLQLKLVDVASGESRRLLTFRPTLLYVSQFLPFFDQYALSHRVWSPNSDALVLPVWDGEENHIYVVPTNGDQPLLIAGGSIAFWSSP